MSSAENFTQSAKHYKNVYLHVHCQQRPHIEGWAQD